MIGKFEVNKWNLARGADAFLLCHMLDPDGYPLSFGNATAINILFKNADDSILVKNIVGAVTTGYINPLTIYSFTITKEDIALLPLGPGQTVEIQIMFGTATQYITFPKSLNVYELPFVGV